MTNEDELSYSEQNTSQTCGEQNNLKLQKILAKLILDIKYEHNTSQTCIDMLLARFRSFFCNAADLFKNDVSHAILIVSILFSYITENQNI